MVDVPPTATSFMGLVSEMAPGEALPFNKTIVPLLGTVLTPVVRVPMGYVNDPELVEGPV